MTFFWEMTEPVKLRKVVCVHLRALEVVCRETRKVHLATATIKIGIGWGERWRSSQNQLLQVLVSSSRA